jgi:hypothetical protein
VDALPNYAERRHQSRPGRRALVAATLEELHGPTSGIAELPHRLMWQAPPMRRFDLDDRYQQCRVYEIVLREAVRVDELQNWLDGPTMLRLWPSLYLPRGVRQAWEECHPKLAQLRAAA